MKDTGLHREIRTELLALIPSDRNPWSSHERSGDISFLREVRGEEIEVAEPDIVFRQHDNVYVVEIELTNQPKRLLGDAFAISIATKGIWGIEKARLGKKSMMIVVDDTKWRSSRRSSGKPNQLAALQEAIGTKLGFTEFFIVSREEA